MKYQSVLYVERKPPSVVRSVNRSGIAKGKYIEELYAFRMRITFCYTVVSKL